MTPRLLFSFPRLCLATLAAFVGVLCAQEQGDVESFFPLQQVLVGEPALLNIQVYGEEPQGQFTSSQATGLDFKRLGNDVIARSILSANIAVSSKRAGTFPVPALQFSLQKGEKKTDDFQLSVFPTDDINWQNVRLGDKVLRVGIILLHPRGTVYAGQTIPLTAKVLIPNDYPISSTGYTEIEKNNIGAWRMEAPFPPNYDRQVSPRPANAVKPRQVEIAGRKYQVANYVTFAAPLSGGSVTVGPGKIQGLQVQVTTKTQRRGFFSQTSRPYVLELEVPEVTFQATALPAGAPETFTGAVGDFSLETSLDVSTELKPGDPVMVNLTVAGRGSLDTLAAPQLVAPESNWKLYPPSRNDSKARRTNQGSVDFTQILRPLVPIEEVPPFVFSFFNPRTASYETLKSAPLPLNLAPLDTSSNNVPEAGLVPIAEMTNILGLIEPQSFSRKKKLTIGAWWHLFPAVLALLLGGHILKRQLPRLRVKDGRKEEVQGELRHLENIEDPANFLRAAAHLAEKRELPSDDFLTELQQERDRNCFQPDQAVEELPRERRREILAALRERLSCLLVLLGLLLVWNPQPAQAFHQEALAAWEKSDFQESLDAYELALQENETPDLLYNIGNCHYRLRQPGRAALFYRRALLLDPKHPEAKQNLAFVERQMGAIPVFQADAPYWARKLTQQVLKTLLAASLWLLVLALLLRFATATSRARTISHTGLIVGSVLFVAFGLLLIFHPGPSKQALAPNAVLVTDTQTVRTEPTAGGSEILQAKAATAMHVLTTRSNWSYVELPDRTRGWIETSALEKI